jgi:hemolysin activation/secretion protein
LLLRWFLKENDPDFKRSHRIFSCGPGPGARQARPVWGSLLVIPLCLVLSAIGSGGTASAQTPQTNDSEEQRRRSQQEAEERKRLQEAPKVSLQEQVLSPSEAEALQGTTLPEETPCFRIEHLVLELPESQTGAGPGRSGVSLSRFRFIQGELDRYSGRRIGYQGLNLIVRRLTAKLLARGYTTTRLGIPEQDLHSGTLRITLIPGVIRAIRFADPSTSGTWRSAFPARPGDLLDLRALEQGLEQMKRVTSQDVDIQIVPGDQPGESDVVLAVRRGKAWKVTATVDDSGSESTGRMQGTLNLALDNPLGLSDLFNVSVSHDLNGHEDRYGTKGSGAYYSVPWGFWTFTGNASQYDYHQTLAGASQAFVSSGKSSDVALTLGYLFHRNQSQKDTFQLRTGMRNGHSYLDDTEIEVQRRANSYCELGWVHKQYLGPAQLDVTLAERWGVPWFGAQPDFPGQAPGSPTFYYRITTLEATVMAPFTLGGRAVRYTGTLRGQTTPNTLYATEMFLIGNRWTVRGFDGNLTLAGEKGALSRNELETSLGPRWLMGFVALDGGRVYGPSTQGLLGKSLVGGVFGLRGAPFPGLNGEAFLGGPLAQPAQFPNRWPVCGFSLSYQY